MIINKKTASKKILKDAKTGDKSLKIKTKTVSFSKAKRVDLKKRVTTKEPTDVFGTNENNFEQQGECSDKIELKSF